MLWAGAEDPQEKSFWVRSRRTIFDAVFRFFTGNALFPFRVWSLFLFRQRNSRAGLARERGAEAFQGSTCRISSLIVGKEERTQVAVSHCTLIEDHLHSSHQVASLFFFFCFLDVSFFFFRGVLGLNVSTAVDCICFNVLIPLLSLFYIFSNFSPLLLFALVNVVGLITLFIFAVLRALGPAHAHTYTNERTEVFFLPDWFLLWCCGTTQSRSGR